MDSVEKFWEEIAELINIKFGNGHPETWNKYKINLFLEDFHSKLEAICQNDTRKAALCGVPETKKGTTPKPTTSYDSFRRIFLKKQSSGNRTTREMFAIYLGYDSAHDFMTKRGIVEEPRIPTPEPPEEESSKSRRRRWIAIVIILIIIILLLIQQCFSSFVGETGYMFVRNDQGIALINLKNKRLYQIVKDRNHIIGFDFDPKTRMLFWADVEDYFDCISSARVNRKFTGIEEPTLNTRLTRRLGFPTGIALDVEHKFIYCADYERSLIAKYDYQGRLLSDSVVKNLKGKPSSIEFDARDETLYWTDLANNKIGRVFLKTGQVEHNFIRNAGDFPDGLSLDTINNKIFWATYQGKEIGCSSIAAPIPKLMTIEQNPSAVEVDALKGILYYTLSYNTRIGEIRLGEKNTIRTLTSKNAFSAGGTSPGVIKIFYIKR